MISSKNAINAKNFTESYNSTERLGERTGGIAEITAPAIGNSGSSPPLCLWRGIGHCPQGGGRSAGNGEDFY